MVKWADYVISDVRYNAEETHIEKVKVHVDLGETVGKAEEEQTRATIVANIKSGITYVTGVKKPDGNWDRGEDVRIIEVDNKEFIRTDANAKASDNLGNLPRF